MAHGGTTDGEAAALVRRTADANAAFVRRDMGGHLAPVTHADDRTPMALFGGAPARGFDASPGRSAKLSRRFRAGASELGSVHACASVVLAAIERQRGEVGGLPEQDWSLHVALVYRREGSGWHLAHRHADSLVNNIGLERAAAIARGRGSAPSRAALRPASGAADGLSGR